MGWAGCDRSALQSDGRDGGIAAEKPAGGKGDTDCPESGGSLPGGRQRDQKYGEEVVNR